MMEVREPFTRQFGPLYSLCSIGLNILKNNIYNPQLTEILELKSSEELSVNKNTTVNIVAAPTRDG